MPQSPKQRPAEILADLGGPPSSPPMYTLLN